MAQRAVWPTLYSRVCWARVGVRLHAGTLCGFGARLARGAGGIAGIFGART